MWNVISTKRSSFFLAGASIFMLASQTVFAQSHAWIDQNRSSLSNNIFLSQSVEGEYGRFEKTYRDTNLALNQATKQSWRGYGVRNGLGVEVFRFTQFSVAHSLLNLRPKESSLENLSGSELSAALAFAFSAPIVNVEFGGGVTASHLNYQNIAEAAKFAGTGYFTSIDLNYFMSPRISVFASGKRHHSLLKSNDSASTLETIRAKRNSLGLGFRVWL